MNQQRGVDPLYAGPRQGAQPSNQGRSGSGGRINGRPTDAATAGGAAPVEANQARAARFEDEKKRIIESCFAKKDPDGVVVESYITHVRVMEDAMYPSHPSPPDSASANKKSRVILVAVRRSGKVRIHKARQNPSGSFSIGKTWNMEDLTAIQSYVAYSPTSQEEQQQQEWAGHTGFTVSLGKPYYWQAPTSKEKDFFIASLVKIYRKYTGGKVPELIGFPPQDIELYTGTSSNQPTPVLRGQTPRPNVADLAAPATPTTNNFSRPQSPYVSHTTNRVTTPTAPQEPTRDRQGSYTGLRDGQSRPSEDGGRSHLRNVVQTQGIYEQSPPVPGDGSVYAEPPQQTKTYPPFQLQPPPLRSVTPKTSQSSLRSTEKRPDASALKANGYSAVTIPQQESSKPHLGVAKSEESSLTASTSDAGASSRPSTATTDKQPTDASRPVPAVDEALMPAKLRPAPLKTPVPRFSYYNQATSNHQTPVGTPTAGPDEKAALDLSDRFMTPDEKSNTSEAGYFGASPKKADRGPQVPEPTSQPGNRAEIYADQTLDVPTPTQDAPTTEQEEAQLDARDEEEYRPGLGPMLKKKPPTKEMSDKWRKAAVAATAFQPRQGGAGARLKAMQEKTTTEPDGITGVVPAPLFRGISNDSVSSAPPVPATVSAEHERPATPLANKTVPRVQLQRQATEEILPVQAPPKVVIQDPKAETQQPPQPPQQSTSPDRTRSRSPQRRKRQRYEAEIERYCSVLGLDPRIMEGRGADFNELLTEFGWEGKLSEKQKVEEFESQIRREIGRAQATGWLGHIEQQDSKVSDLARAFEKAIAECEELDGLLTLYSHELDTLHDDIEYIEAQSQGLQVQTANQKLLQSELQSLLETLTISSSDIRALKTAPLGSVEDIQMVEKALTLLFRAMITIDPEIRQNRMRQQAANTSDRSGVGVYADTEIGQIRAVRQKKDEYREETLQFLRRFNQHMTAVFKAAEHRTSDEHSRVVGSSATSLNLKAIQASRQEMWMYNAMMLFVREVNTYEWQTLITSYEINIKSSYQEQFRDHAAAQRRVARKLAPEDQEALFTHQEKERADESLTSTAARKLTVKRGKTVKAVGLRQSFGDRKDGQKEAFDVFDAVLKQQSKIISEEQNFIVHFFHLNSHSNADFVDITTSRVPDMRPLPNLSTKQSYDPDRNLAKIVQQVTDGIYSFWATDMQALVEWVLQTDALQGVGVLTSLEVCLAEYEETNQEYLTRTLRLLHERLTGLFHKFVEEQLRAIEETKVKVKKRKGIISFMKTFPVFNTAVENMIHGINPRNESLEVRFIVNDAYLKILKAMWESLNFIARDNPAGGSGGGQSNPTGGDPEDKEALNYHVLLIENMNHFAEEVDAQQNVVLNEWIDKAKHDMEVHLSGYIEAVIRRPLGKWLDFLESTEALMKNTESYVGIADKASHSRSSAKKVLGAYDAKEIRKGIDTLKRRIEKHFGEVDDPNTSRSLISRVFDECSIRYQHAHDRMKVVIDRVYEGGLEIDWRKEEVATLFKR